MRSILFAAVASAVVAHAAVSDAASQRVRDDILTVLPSAEMAAQEAKACGKEELSASVTHAFTALVTDAGFEESYAAQLLRDEFDRSYGNVTPTQCDEEDLVKQVHFMEAFSKIAQADMKVP